MATEEQVANIIIDASIEAKLSWWEFSNRLSDEQKSSNTILTILTDYILSGHFDRSSYFALLLIREESPNLYSKLSSKIKASIVCDYLSTCTTCNDFGVYNVDQRFDGEASTTIVECGHEAISQLRSLIQNKSPLTASGSEEAHISIDNQYRICDIAYCCIKKIRCETISFYKNPKQRDVEIESER